MFSGFLKIAPNGLLSNSIFIFLLYMYYLNHSYPIKLLVILFLFIHITFKYHIMFSKYTLQGNHFIVKPLPIHLLIHPPTKYVLLRSKYCNKGLKVKTYFKTLNASFCISYQYQFCLFLIISLMILLTEIYRKNICILSILRTSLNLVYILGSTIFQ